MMEPLNLESAVAEGLDPPLPARPARHGQEAEFQCGCGAWRRPLEFARMVPAGKRKARWLCGLCQGRDRRARRAAERASARPSPEALRHAAYLKLDRQLKAAMAELLERLPPEQLGPKGRAYIEARAAVRRRHPKG